MKLRKKWPDKIGYLLILPFYFIFIYFWFTPAVQVFIDSFTNYSLIGEYKFIGLQNYKELLMDANFKKGIANTLIYTGCTLIPIMFLGFTSAMLVNSSLIKTKFARTVLFFPHVISMVSISMVWLLIFEPNLGFMNFFLEHIGLSPSRWLQSPKTAMSAIVIMSIWKSTGYNMIIYLSGLQSVPESFYEVARIEGANLWQRIRYITFPMVSPTTFLLFVTGLIGSFNVFDQVNVLTSGGPANATTTIVHQIYLNGFTYFKMGYASAQSVVLLILVIFVTTMSNKFGNKASDLEIG